MCSAFARRAVRWRAGVALAPEVRQEAAEVLVECCELGHGEHNTVLRCLPGALPSEPGQAAAHGAGHHPRDDPRQAGAGAPGYIEDLAPITDRLSVSSRGVGLRITPVGFRACQVGWPVVALNRVLRRSQEIVIPAKHNWLAAIHTDQRLGHRVPRPPGPTEQPGEHRSAGLDDLVGGSIAYGLTEVQRGRDERQHAFPAGGSHRRGQRLPDHQVTVLRSIAWGRARRSRSASAC